jgi:hypothetical protein
LFGNYFLKPIMLVDCNLFVNRPAPDISQVEAGLSPVPSEFTSGKRLLNTKNGVAWRRLHHGTAKLKGVHGSAHLLAFFAMV